MHTFFFMYEAVHTVRHARGGGGGGGGMGGGAGVGGCRARRHEALHGGVGYLADRYVMLILNFICLFSAVQLNALCSRDECLLTAYKEGLASRSVTWGCGVSGRSLRNANFKFYLPVFSRSTECLVQSWRVPTYCVLCQAFCTLGYILPTPNETRGRFCRTGSRLPTLSD